MIGRRLVLLCALVAYAAATFGVASRLERTADEVKYVNAGRAIVNAGWEHELSRLHGPLPFYANQLFVSDFPTGGVRHDDPDPVLLTRSRLGMLGFGIAAAVLVYVWSRGVFGRRAACVSVIAFALHPLMIGYGALTAVDMAYTAGLLLCLYALWRYWMEPRPVRAALVGAALGVALATKFLALLAVPTVYVTVALRAWFTRGSTAERVKRTALSKLLVVVCAWASLTLCYGFGVETAPTDPSVYETAWIAALVDLPIVGHLLGTLPAPFLLGIDYQAAAGEMDVWTYVNGTFAPIQGDYYLWTLLRKSPEWWVVVGLALALFRLVPWMRACPARRAWAAAVLPTAALLFVYLSFFAQLQLGVRYVLPLIGLSFVPFGAVVDEWPLRRLSSRGLATVAALWIAVSAADLARVWPNAIAYYNASSGDAGEAHRWFMDSNSDWGQRRASGREELEARGVRIVERGQGPRTGTLAIYLRDLVVRDPADPSRRYHWLDALEPIDHVGSAWWVFESTVEAWERAAEGGDERVREHLAVILLAEGRRDDARPWIESLSEERRAVLEVLARAGTEEAAEPAVEVAAWTDVGRFDRAEELLRRPDAVPKPFHRTMLAEALGRQQRWDEALEVIEADPPKHAAGRLLHAELLRRGERFRDALALLRAHADEWSEVDRARARAVEDAIEEVRSFRALLY